MGHRQIQRVLYPTLFEDAEQIRIYQAQCDYPGGLFSLDFRGGRPAAFEFLRNLRIARNAVSLGGVETLACHPKTTTHSGMSRAGTRRSRYRRRPGARLGRASKTGVICWPISSRPCTP